MSHGRPLALTDSQLTAIVTAATVLPSSWRGRYLSSVADLLTLRDEIDDREVHAAIEVVIDRLTGRAA